MDNNTLHWFVIYTRSRFEKKVAEDLSEMKFEFYLPTMKTLRQWSDRKKKIEIPVFRSYVFIRTTFSRIKSLVLPLGAVKIVSFEGIPAIVPDIQIQNLKILFGTHEKFEITVQNFDIGDPVEVITGPLRGIKGKFTDYAGKKYIMLEVDVLKQSLIVSINPIFIRRLQPEPAL